MANLSDYLENLLLTWHLTSNSATRPTAWHVALGTASSDTGLTGEPSANGYSRQSVAWSVSAATASNNAQLTFGPCTSAAWGTMSNIAVFDASVGGNLLWQGALVSSRTVDVGDTLTVATSALTLTLA